MTDFSKPVQWLEGDRHHVGKVAIVRYSPCCMGHCYYKRNKGSARRVFVVHSHTGDLEYVQTDKLSQYPSEPIEEPTK